MIPSILLTGSLMAALSMPPAHAPSLPRPPMATCLDVDVQYRAETASIDASVRWGCPSMAPHAVATLRIDGVAADARLLPPRATLLLHGKADPRELPVIACVSLEQGPLAEPAVLVPAQCREVGVVPPATRRLPGGFEVVDSWR